MTARATLALLAVASATVAVHGGEEVLPHFDGSTRSPEYHGPGRDHPPPTDLDEVRIGYFGPSDPDDPDGGDLWLAAGMAIEEANASGGYDGLPYRLVPSWSGNPWSSGAADLARSVYGEGVWAILGSIDGASTHLAETIVAKARVTLVSPGSTDKTVNLANVAWAFSCLPADDSLARVLAAEVAERAGGLSPLLISATDHDSHMAVVALLAAFEGAGIAPARHVEFDPEESDPETLIERAGVEAPDPIVVVAAPRPSARIVVQLRASDHDGPLFGWAAMGRRAFVETAGTAADGVVFPLPCDPEFTAGDFGREFSRRYGKTADCTTVQTYDATRLVIEAIDRAGLNRALARDALAAIASWSGAAGKIEWGPLGQNLREPTLATVLEGRVVPLERRPD